MTTRSWLPADAPSARLIWRAAVLSLLVAAAGSPVQAQTGSLSPQAAAQINALMLEKAARTPAQHKMSSQLVYAMKVARRDAITLSVPGLNPRLPDVNARGAVVDVRVDVSDALLSQLRGLGAEVLDVSATYRNVRLRVPIDRLEAVAALPQVSYIQPKQEAMTSRLAPPRPGSLGPDRAQLLAEKRRQRADLLGDLRRTLAGDDPLTSVGSQNSQGDVTHRANVARSIYGVSGAGVKIGVLSDGVTNLAASQGLGDLGTVTVLAGQTGSGDEGTAMLEIIHDLAPNAALYFATAFNGQASFAQNIRNLAAAGCTIIVDDVGYFAESPFQDGQTGTSPTNGGIIAQAVKDVANGGVLYFSSAANSGNKNDGTSGTWEGDFVDGGAAGGPLLGAGQVHNFGGATYNSLVASVGNPISLFWADPLAGSANDYDLYLLDSAGAAIVDASTDFQSGTDDPLEIMNGGSAGQRVVIVKFAGSARFMHLATNRNRLSISTAGETHGHAATTAPNSFGVAAVSAIAVAPSPFSGSNKVETFSSDGPRRIFFAQNGGALTPGNFTSTGGLVLQKPDLTAADGVSVTGVGGFPSPFYGTSAAAPHAAAIAGLVKSRKLTLTATEIRTALFASAIDIEAAGVDRDSGIGIIMADTAVAAVPFTKKSPSDFDGDRTSDVGVFRPSTGTWYIRNTASGTGISLVWGGGADIPVVGDYDGDGKADIAVFRPSTGTWYVRYTSTGSGITLVWGGGTDIPVPADYDGDGTTDIAIFRPSTGTWYVRYTATGSGPSLVWGGGSDVPAVDDYDGDGKADIAIFRPSTGTWYVRYSATGSGFSLVFGGGTDIPVTGDYDGDGTADIAIFRPSTGTWYIRYTATGSGPSLVWGGTGDIPTPGDFDADGRMDIAIFRPSTGAWYIRYSASGAGTSFVWGGGSDIPTLKRP